MATALFIKREDFVRNTIVDGSVDQDKYSQFIKGAQIMHIRNYLGSDLYEKISNDIIAGTMTADYQLLLNDYIQPMLIHFTMVDYLPFANYALKNGGVFKHWLRQRKWCLDVPRRTQSSKRLLGCYSSRIIFENHHCIALLYRKFSNGWWNAIQIQRLRSTCRLSN